MGSASASPPCPSPVPPSTLPFSPGYYQPHDPYLLPPWGPPRVLPVATGVPPVVSGVTPVALGVPAGIPPVASVEDNNAGSISNEEDD